MPGLPPGQGRARGKSEARKGENESAHNILPKNIR
jgi:hypothetical protein